MDVGRDWPTLTQDIEDRSLGGVLQRSSVAVELCQFSIDEQGVYVVSRKKWDFSEEEERAKFLADVDRRDLPCCGCTVKAGDEQT